MKRITELQSIKIPKIRMIGNYISPIQDTIFEITLDISSIISISKINDDIIVWMNMFIGYILLLILIQVLMVQING